VRRLLEQAFGCSVLSKMLAGFVLLYLFTDLRLLTHYFTFGQLHKRIVCQAPR
jgi:hypothetical protein